jgi:F-type H+-transporting ATPase subunit gamma
MPSIRQIRQRVRSVESTSKITNAMEMIAASKMRRAQQNVLASRPYATALLNILSDLAQRSLSGEVQDVNPLLEVREANTIGVIVVTPDRGLAGGLSSNIIRTAENFISGQSASVKVVTVGRKGKDYMARSQRDIVAEFTQISEYPTLDDARPAAKIVQDEYIAGTMDRVHVIYPEFVNTVVQTPTVRQLLPIEPSDTSSTDSVAGIDFAYEPDAETVLSGLLPRMVEMWVFHAFLELSASEQSARMVAMNAATKAAQEMISDLTLVYNKARQEIITTELLDIVGGVAALEQS